MRFDWGVLSSIITTMTWLLMAIAWFAQAEFNSKTRARLKALEAKRPVDLHITVDRPEHVAQAVYRVLPHPDWIGR